MLKYNDDHSSQNEQEADSKEDQQIASEDCIPDTDKIVLEKETKVDNSAAGLKKDGWSFDPQSNEFIGIRVRRFISTIT